MGEDDLARGLHHVAYEMLMLAGALDLVEWHTLVAPEESQALVEFAAPNGLVELRALHARNIAEFLLNKGKRKDYLTVDQYFRKFEVPEKDAIKRLHKKACDQVAHLTKNRVTDEEQATGSKDKRWPLPAFAPLFRGALLFHEKLFESHWPQKVSGDTVALLVLSGPALASTLGRLEQLAGEEEDKNGMSRGRPAEGDHA
jgi:hypothetical protein